MEIDEQMRMLGLAEAGLQVHHFGARVPAVAEVGLALTGKARESVFQDIEVDAAGSGDGLALFRTHEVERVAVRAYTADQDDVAEWQEMGIAEQMQLVGDPLVESDQMMRDGGWIAAKFPVKQVPHDAAMCIDFTDADEIVYRLRHGVAVVSPATGPVAER